MEAIELISQDLFDKVRSRYSNLEMGDESGNVTSDPRMARFFDFNFTLEGTNLGRVSISINERGSLKLFYGQGILEGADPVTQESWFNFLREMRNFAKRRLLRFDTRDITKTNLDKTDFQYLAQTGSKELTMSENKMFGSSKSSYLKHPSNNATLIVRHTESINTEQRGSRSRHIKALFIQNEAGERYKYPFNHLAGGKAMLEHVRNGGSPYDDHGKAIIGMSEQIIQLASFKRNVGLYDSMDHGATDIIGKASAKLESLRTQITQLSKPSHYRAWKESFTPSKYESNIDQATIEDYKSKFTVNSFKEDLAQFFPLIHSIMQEAGTINLESVVDESPVSGHPKDCDCDCCQGIAEDQATCTCTGPKEKQVKEFAAFESWANSIVESKLTDDEIGSLQELLSDETDVGLDGTNAIQSLQGIGIKDSELEAMIKQASPNGSLKTVVTMWLNKNGDTGAIKQLGLEDSDAEPAEEPPEDDVPTDTEVPPAPIQQAPTDAETPLPTAEEDDEDMVQNPEEAESVGTEMPSLLDIAELVKSFYDRETKKFPLGVTGVVTKVRKEFGDKAGELAERLCLHLTGEHPEQIEAEVDEASFVSPEEATLHTGAIKKMGALVDKLNSLYIRAKREGNVPAMKEIKHRLAVLSSKKNDLQTNLNQRQSAEVEDEGYQVLPNIDHEKYTDLSYQGLEGPFRLKSGKIVYYDKKEGKYYDRDTDMFLSHDEYDSHVNETATPGYVKYEEMVNRISEVIAKLWHQGEDSETIGQLKDRVAQHLGYDPKDSIYDQAWFSSLSHASVNGELDKPEDDFDYTDYSMRQGEMGNPDRMREGKFVKGPGGVPSDRYGNPKQEKPPKDILTVKLKDLEKNKRENPGQSAFKTQNEKVKKYTSEDIDRIKTLSGIKK